MLLMRRKLDLTGFKWKGCQVLKFEYVARSYTSYHYMWRCLCHCKKQFVARVDHIQEGRVMSCGCLKRHTKESLSKWLEEAPRTCTGCVIWDRYIDKKTGSGRLHFEGRQWLAHRLFYSLFVEELKPGESLIKRVCEERACVNPVHLWKISEIPKIYASS